MMRCAAAVALAVSAVALAGCFPQGDYQCDLDTDCSGGEVCARTHECLAASDVRSVKIDWTIEGQPDTVTGCPALGLTDMTIQFTGDQTELSFAPVPCAGGSYFIDKLPLRFSEVSLAGNTADGAQYYGDTPVGVDAEYTITLTEF
jgi:hypothetical protein